MHRFFVEKPVIQVGETVFLSPEESAHSARVLRLQPGEQVCLLDGKNLWMAELTAVSEKETEALVKELLPSTEPPCAAVLWQGLPKAEKLELIVQKATELGCESVWPVVMERSIAKADKADRDEKKRERMQRIALEASKQSGRAKVPEIRASLSWKAALKEAEKASFDLILVAWEEEHALPLSKAVKKYMAEKGVPGKVLIVIGPEGGISRQEYEQLKGLGAKAVTLGPRILRTETAGLCSLSVLWSALGEM